jgi:hypothetical protein
MKAKWVVDVKGSVPPNQGVKDSPIDMEISVLRDDFEHGKRSWGWSCEDKLIISCEGGPCNIMVKQIILDKLVKVAQEVADELNHPLATFQ